MTSWFKKTLAVEQFEVVATQKVESPQDILLCECCRTGNITAVRNFLKSPSSDPSIRNNLPVRNASKYGHFAIVDLLIANDKCNPGDENNEAIQNAAEGGFSEIARILAAHGKVSLDENYDKAMKLAESKGHTETLIVLKVTKSIRSNLIK
jgi:hypothetical protein